MELTSQVKTGTYEHYKGRNYQVIAVGKDCDTLRDVVIYKALYQTDEFPMGQVWTRTLDDFVATVKKGKERVPRFKYVGY